MSTNRVGQCYLTKRIRRKIELKERGYGSVKRMKHEEIKAQRKKALKAQAKKRQAARECNAAIKKMRKKQKQQTKEA